MDQKFEFFSDDYVFDSEDSPSDDARELVVRLDKWLWAARFFKTRAVARLAVEKGKVFYNGERTKPSREIEVGGIIYIQQGRLEKTVIVRGLSTRRRGTEESVQLFEETEESRLNREQAPLFESNHFKHQAQPFYLSVPKQKTPHYNYNAQPNRQPKEGQGRGLRFLRRALNKNASQAARPTTSYSNYSKADFEHCD